MVKCWTLGFFGSGRDLRIMTLGSVSGSVLGVESA